MIPIENLENAIIDEWKKLKKPADVKLIADKAKVSTQTVYNVFVRRKYTMELFAIMQEFYAERRAMLERAYAEIKTKNPE